MKFQELSCRYRKLVILCSTQSADRVTIKTVAYDDFFK